MRIYLNPLKDGRATTKEGKRAEQQAVTELCQAVATYAQSGKLVVIPTDTVYGIGTTPKDPQAVKNLLAAKGRSRQMPPPVLVSRVEDLDSFCQPSALAKKLAKAAWPGALTLIVPAPNIQWDLGDLKGTVAVRMPDHPLTLKILDTSGPLAVTSANLTGKPAANTAREAVEYFQDAVSVYVDSGQASAEAVASTIVDTTGAEWKILRQGHLTQSDLSQMVPEAKWA